MTQPRLDNGLTPIAEQRLLNMVLRRTRTGRFPVDLTAAEISEEVAAHGMTPAIEATITAWGGLKKDDRTAQVAVKNIVAMARVNQADDLHEDDKRNPNLHLHAHAQLAPSEGVRHLIARDPEFLEYLDQRPHVESDGDSGAVGATGEPRAVEAGATPPATQPGTNGHSNGKAH